MELRIEKFEYGYRPDVIAPDENILKILGEQGIRDLVSKHYDLLTESPIKNLFPEKGLGLELAKKHSADFFIQRFGGPDYFNKTRGKPMLATRHSYFKITPTARIEWLKIYQKLLPELNLPEEILENYWKYLHDFSNWMVNTPE